MNQLHALICTHCGEPLFRDGDQYVCKTCGCHFEADHQEELDARIRALLSEEKMEKLANARRLLYQATHAKNPSQDAVISTARLLLSLHQDEPLAEIYLHSHDEDPYELVRVLSHASLDSFQAKEAYSWLLPSLSSRTIGPLKDFVSRHFSNEERTVRLNQIEEEAAKLEDGLYEANLPRDVFLAYSSSDMAKVIETMDLLEENGLVVFAAFRNMRHGKGAQENYLSTIKEAMEACKCFVFLSSAASRQMSCDAMRVELPYLISNLPKKPRVEYMVSDYGEHTPFMVRNILKSAFPTQEQVREGEELVARVYGLLQGSEDAEKKRRDEFVDALAEEKRREEERKAAEEQAKVSREQKLKDSLTVPYVEGNYVYYGRFPQSKARGDAPGLAMEFGGSRFLVEPIKWRILEVRGNEAYLISDRPLERLAFHSTPEKIENYGGGKPYPNDFQHSDIRSILNGPFIKNAFVDGGACLIPIDGDKVSLPTKEDLENPKYGFVDPEDRFSVPTDFAIAKGAFSDFRSHTGLYWTKTPCPGEPCNVYYSDHNGEISDVGVGYVLNYGVANQDYCVRPVIKIRLP